MNLTKYVQEVSLEDFGRPFLHQTIWNLAFDWRSVFLSGHSSFNLSPRKIWLGNFRKIVAMYCHPTFYYMKRAIAIRIKISRPCSKGRQLVMPPSVDKSYKIYVCTICGQNSGESGSWSAKSTAVGVAEGHSSIRATDPGNRPWVGWQWLDFRIYTNNRR